ncbi:MAG: hypothetical protein Fur003_5880 [Candidatus Dojkabacteria bacterium]
MMSDSVNILNNYLIDYGLTPEEAKVMALILLGKTKPLEISKETKLSRSKVYRVIEKLLAQELILAEIRGYGSNYTANSIENIQKLLYKEKNLLETKRESLDLIEKELAKVTPQNARTKVLHYTGEAGYKQVNWNSTKAKGLIRIYEFSTINELIDRSFGEELRLELVKNNIKIKQITNHTKFDEWTNITGIVDLWDVRYIPKYIFEITAESFIYNNTFTTYEKRKDEIAIIEIINKGVAKMQKQLFDTLWEQATPLKKIGNKGAAVLA